MVSVIATLKSFQRSGANVFLDPSGRLLERRRAPDGTEAISEIDSPRHAELRAYLEARSSSQRPPLTANSSTPRPSLYQEVWWNLTASLAEGFPYARFPTIIDLGETDVQTAIRAIRTVLKRHRVLRSVFAIRQGILAVDFCSVDEIDIPMSFVKSKEELVEFLRMEGATTPLITTRPPLRIHVAMCGSRLLASFVFHHAIFDYVSAGILESDLNRCLRREDALDEDLQELDFYDWAAWERDWFESAAGEQVCRYWRNWRERVPSLCSPRGDGLDWSSGTRTKHRVDINAAFVERMNQRARQSRTTPFVIALSAYAIALHRWSGKAHFPIRAVGSSRVGPFVASGMGLFMCHDPIEVDLQGLTHMDGVIDALCAEYRSSVALRIPTHATGTGADYSTLHRTIGASMNFVSGAAGPVSRAPLLEPAISLPDPNEEPTNWLVPQPTIVLELFGRQGALSGAFSFNDKVIGREEQRRIVCLFGQAMWNCLDADGPI